MQEPLLLQGLAHKMIVTAACGQSHTVLLSREGEVGTGVRFVGQGWAPRKIIPLSPYIPSGFCVRQE